jgi:Tfp pilus assembly protein PilX
MNTPPILQREQGYVLLLTLIVLVVLLFGVLFVTRGDLLQTAMTGNTVQRQKNLQIGDMALQQVRSAIVQTACGGNQNTCQQLQNTAQGKPWFPVTDAGSALPWSGTTPTQAFWTSCLANSTCDTLTHIQSSVLGNLNPAPAAIPGSSNILVAVVPTTLPADPSACYVMFPNGSSTSNSTYTANYYEIFLNIREANGQTGASTESVYKLCTAS